MRSLRDFIKTARGKTATYRMPVLVKVSLGVLVLLGGLSLYFGLRPNQEIANALSSFALVVTLVVLVIYTRYTALDARASSYPAVSFRPTVRQIEDEMYFQLHMTNYSNHQARCWCRLNPSYRSHPSEPAVNLTMKDGMDFYRASSHFDILPRQSVHGAAFLLSVFFQGPEIEYWNEMARIVHARSGFPRLHFDIEFWYEVTELGFKSDRLKQQYYYDFAIRKLVLDY